MVKTQESMIRRKSDNAPVYCIQANIQFYSGSSVNGIIDTNTMVSMTNMTAEQIGRIKLIAYYNNNLFSVLFSYTNSCIGGFNVNYELLGKRIKAERNKLNLTQEKLAEDVDISTAYLGQIERGERNVTL